MYVHVLVFLPHSRLMGLYSRVLLLFLLTVVQIVSVVERGSWDEFISLEGGGNVHMRLQFVLSEDERNRVRSMVLFPFTLVFPLLDLV